jgi:hypothetical protein
MANVKVYFQVFLHIFVSTTSATATHHLYGSFRVEHPKVRSTFVQGGENVPHTAGSLLTDAQTSLNQLKDHVSSVEEKWREVDQRSSLAHGSHKRLLTHTSRKLHQGQAWLGSPGDEMWIDGIMEQAETEKLHPKVEGHGEQLLIGHNETMTPNTSSATKGAKLSSTYQGYKGKGCAEGCIERGNCNLEDGRCECPIGFTGTSWRNNLHAL